ncbi:ParB-like nuclease domain protein [Gordonia phage Evaa]|nr:ParB-like nuclease domain protein [Gordonia phage Evaa]
MASKNPPRPAVGTTTRIAPRELNVYHRNARIGDVDLIAGSLKTNGQYKPIVVNVGTATGRPNEVLAGNHTLKAFRDLGERYPDDERWEAILVHWVDVDDDRAARIVLADNKIAEAGGYDETELYDLVKGLGGDFEGTGFTVDDEQRLADLAKLFSGPADGESGDNPGEPSGDVTIDLGKVPKACSEVGLTVGVIRVKVPRGVYEAWYDELREEIGYDDAAIEAEIVRRLGMN